jgi:glycosyltransferase involved in cell wall biosynthesis
MISICVTVKNRSRLSIDSHELLLFPNCVKSIVESTRKYPNCELVIADWQSDDWPLVDWVQQAAAPVGVQILTIAESPFSRGKGLNRAAQAAKGEVLLFLDADSLLCESVIAKGLECVRQGKAYFPIDFSFDEPSHESGWWKQEGFGTCMLGKDVFASAGGWPEYNSWGKEDEHFFTRIRFLVEVAREEVPGFYHQWHPTDIAWKDRYGGRSPAELLAMQQQEKAANLSQIRKTVRELANFLEPAERFVLVDDAWFGNELLPGRIAIPFLERDGEYWGPPPDDETAIRELERLRSSGANFMVFLWPTFWWLECYSGLSHHLRTRYRSILQNERLIVFDLMEGKSAIRESAL